jgi:putative ABC transport system permease protein
VKLRRFSGLSFRNLRARVQRTLLTAVGIVLGVGIVFGVLTLSNTMSGTFEELFTRAYGSADLTVTAAGGSGGFDQKTVEEVRGYEGVESAAPRYSLSSSLILDTGQKNSTPEVRTLRRRAAVCKARNGLRTHRRTLPTEWQGAHPRRRFCKEFRARDR